MKDIHITVPDELHDTIKYLAEEDNRKISAVARIAIINYLRARKRISREKFVKGMNKKKEGVKL